jgi:hypothetical protein
MFDDDYRAPALDKGVTLSWEIKLTKRQFAKAYGKPERGTDCRAIAWDINVHHSTKTRLR